jgi:uncharacterized protein YvpB
MVLVGVLSPAPLSARAAAPQKGGLILDGWGGLHAFGGAVVNTGNAPSWAGWDIARAIAVRDDGTGGWTLDGWGGIHEWGAAASISSPAYTYGVDIARDLVVVSRGVDGDLDGRQGYVLDGYGGIHPWGGAPSLTGPTATTDVARSLLVHDSTAGTPDGGWVLLADGTLHAFGGAVGKAAPVTSDNRPEWQKVRPAPGGGYLVGHWGRVRTSGSVSPYWSGYGDWGGWDIQRDIRLFTSANPSPQSQPMSAAAASLASAAQAPHGGVTLDAWGGVHPFGEVNINTSGYPYWQGWDIARSVQVRDDGSGGWTLDGWGNIHAWGAAPAIQTPGYWPGWDIARAFVATSVDGSGIADGRQGYLLDGWGGVHPWGGAPNIGAPPYLTGFDVYKGLAVHTAADGTPDGGWAMDAVGHTYAFGNAPALGDVSAVAGRPIYLAVHASAHGWYAVAQYGKVFGFGTGYMQPDWNGWGDFGSWKIINDVTLINPVDPGGSDQPLSGGAAQSFGTATYARYLLAAPLYKQTHPLDCEAATLQIVLAERGTAISQDAELQYWGADLRPAVKDSAGNILRWGDPYANFVGNVNASEWNAGGYGIYYPPLVRLANALGHNAIGKEQWSVSALFDLVVEGYPAAVEGTFNMGYATPRDYTAWDGRTVQYTLNNHVFALVGIDFGARTVIINDPYTATQKVFSWADFIRSFSYIDNMATVVS